MIFQYNKKSLRIIQYHRTLQSYDTRDAYPPKHYVRLFQLIIDFITIIEENQK